MVAFSLLGECAERAQRDDSFHLRLRADSTSVRIHRSLSPQMVRQRLVLQRGYVVPGRLKLAPTNVSIQAGDHSLGHEGTEKW